MSFDSNQTLDNVFSTACRTYADSPAFTCMNKTITYRELDNLAAKFTAYIQQCTQLQPGDRIAIQMPNILQYPVVVIGAIRAGLIVVNANPLYTAHEIKHQLNDSGAKALVVLANIAKNAASIIHETSVEQVIVTELADLHSPVKRLLLNFAVKYLKKMVPPFSFPQHISFLHALNSTTHPAQAVPCSPDDVAILQYTGGTTGVAKGAMLTHRNLVANMLQVNLHMQEVFRLNQDLYVAPLPLYHIYAFTIHCTSALSLGNHNILIPNPRAIKDLVAAIKGKPFTCFVGLNTLFNALLRDPDFLKLDFSHLLITSSGGMALTAETAKRWTQVTGSPLSEGYGLTETSPVVTINPPGAVQQGTVGTPVPETDCKVIDDDGNTLLVGEPGELCVRGPQVMKGYWQRPEATAEVLDSSGWLKTGDIAIIQQDGYIKIVDRKKDMINVSGFKVFPNEVEDVLSSHPDIVEAAVIGITDNEGNETVKAFVVTTNSELTVADVRSFAKTKLTPYKVPHAVEFRSALPKSNVGKVLRRELRN